MHRTARWQLISRCVLAILASLSCAFATAGPATAAAAAPGSPQGPLVAAASDLQFALQEVLQRFAGDTGIVARVTYGSSGNFARQIAQGAPFELFLSADESYVESLAAQGLTRGTGDLYGIGRIVLFVPHGSPLQPDAVLEDLGRRLRDGSLGRIAIANPAHAPYGRAAEQALRELHLWEPLQDRLVLGENVAQAAQFASTGNTDGGIIAWSLALAPPLRSRGRYALLPASLHAPLRQRMVLLKQASPGAEQLYAYLRSNTARAILARYGFGLPEE
jgi:molybdate transport system substrate-binding protein